LESHWNRIGIALEWHWNRTLRLYHTGTEPVPSLSQFALLWITWVGMHFISGLVGRVRLRLVAASAHPDCLLIVSGYECPGQARGGRPALACGSLNRGQGGKALCLLVITRGRVSLSGLWPGQGEGCDERVRVHRYTMSQQSGDQCTTLLLGHKLAEAAQASKAATALQRKATKCA